MRSNSTTQSAGRMVPALKWKHVRRVAAGLAGLLALLASFGARAAMLDCSVTLTSAYLGDVGGNGTYATWLVYNYTTSTGTSVSGTADILMSNPAANAITATALTALSVGKTALMIRFLNSAGESSDAVCGSGTTRTDLIGIWYQA